MHHIRVDVVSQTCSPDEAVFKESGIFKRYVHEPRSLLEKAYMATRPKLRDQMRRACASGQDWNRQPGGFTLIEVVAVLIILGIIATISVMRFSETNAKAVAEADSLASAIRYAQARAMSDINLWGVQVNAADYRIRKHATDDTETDEIMPGEGTEHVFESPVTATGGTGTYWFDYRGRPVDSTGAAIGSDQIITLDGEPDVTVTITRETGFVQ